jgi:hypothetical protein
MKSRKRTITVIAVVCCGLFATAKPNFKPDTPLLTKLLCSKNLNDFNDEIYAFWLNDKDLPDDFNLKKEMRLQLNSTSNNAELTQITLALHDYFHFISQEISHGDFSEKLKILTSLEIGDHSSPEIVDLQSKWQAHKSRFQKLQVRYAHLCQKFLSPLDKFDAVPTPVNPPTPPRGLNNALWGLRIAFATSYQSCKTLDLPAIDESVENLEGIAISGTHSNGVGKKRVYKNTSKILASHYYYKNLTPLDKSCYLPETHPLIYDYGGKPATKSTSQSTLDLFTNQGSGTNVLGIDCSGFVFTALARGGLKLSPEKNLKAAYVHGVSAKMFKDPQKNGLKCFYPITVSADKNLMGGEVAASSGHVVMLDDIGSDPFGIKNIKSLSDCNSTNVSYRHFNFSILQSSPYKNAIGIGKAKAAAYLAESASMRAGFEKYAIAACQTQFGKSQTPKSSDVTIIRHEGSPACINLDYIALNREACVSSCRLN